VRAAHVSDTKEQLVLGVALTDDRCPAEHDRVGTMLWSRQFGEDESRHDGLDERPDACLDHDENVGVWTLGRRHTETS